MNARPPTIAAEDLMGPSVLNCQWRPSLSGNFPGATPVRPGLPRNIGQLSAVATPSADAENTNTAARADPNILGAIEITSQRFPISSAQASVPNGRARCPQRAAPERNALSCSRPAEDSGPYQKPVVVYFLIFSHLPVFADFRTA